MIKKLSYRNHFQVMDMLLEEEEMNDKIIDCINYHGYDYSECKAYGDFDEVFRLRGMFLINKDECMVYYRDNINEDLLKKLKGINNIKYISGKKESVEAMQEVLKDYIIWDTTLAVLCEDKTKEYSEEDIECVKEDDYKEMYKYYISVFKDKIKFTEKNVRDIYKNNYAIAYCIKKHGQIISSAEFYNSLTAYMTIMGVGTIEEYRRRGYSQRCVAKVCREIMKFGKKPILRWEREEAGKLYKKLGFQDIGCYRVCTKKA